MSRIHLIDPKGEKSKIYPYKSLNTLCGLYSGEYIVRDDMTSLREHEKIVCKKCLKKYEKETK